MILDNEYLRSLNDEQHFDLRNKNILTIKVKAFDGFNHLRYLNLLNNQLSTLDNQIFNGLASLYHLDLSNNQLSTLDKEIFKGLANLNYLILSNNQLSTLDKEIFKGLANLKYLFLSNNQLSKLDKEIFKGLESLKSLNLSNNQLSTLDIQIFNGLEKLARLNLSNNPLSTLDYQIFNGLESLFYLDLSNNKNGDKFLSFEPAIFDKLHRLKRFHFRFNSLDGFNASFNLPTHCDFSFCQLNDKEKKDKFISDFNSCFLKNIQINVDKILFYFTIFNENDFKKCAIKDKLHFDKFRQLKEKGYVNIIKTRSDNNFDKKFAQLKSFKIEKIPFLSIICGINGIGKTSVLKYIYLNLKSFIYKNDDNYSNDFITDNKLKYAKNKVYPLFLKLNNDSIEPIDLDFLKDCVSSNLYEIKTSINPNIERGDISIYELYSLEKILIFLKNKSENVNKHLNENKFKYELDLDAKFIKEFKFTKQDITFRKPKDHKYKVKLENLSPGEHLILIILLWQYVFKNFLIRGQTLILLDEPDSHLHPSAVGEFLTALTNLVELGVQVMLTTHNPVTVSLARSENLIHLIEKNGILSVQPIENKTQPIDVLTNDLVYVNQRIRVCLLEGEGGDFKYYSFIKDKILNEIPRFSEKKTIPIVFRGVGSKQFQQLFSKQKILDEDGKHLFNEKDLLFGLRDGDAFIPDIYDHLLNKNNTDLSANDLNEAKKIVEEKRRESTRNLFILERYSLENHLYDPINIFFGLVYLLNSNDESKNQVNEYLDKIRGSNSILIHSDPAETTKLIDNFYDKLEKKEIKSFNDFCRDKSWFNKKEKTLILNCILDGTINYLIDTLITNKPRGFNKDLLKQLNNKFNEKSIKEQFEQRGSKLGNGYNITKIGKCADDKLKQVKIYFGDESTEVKYDPILLYFPGKELYNIFDSGDLKLSSKSFKLSDLIKTSMLNEYIVFILSSEMKKNFKFLKFNYNQKKDMLDPIQFYFGLYSIGMKQTNNYNKNLIMKITDNIFCEKSYCSLEELDESKLNEMLKAITKNFNSKYKTVDSISLDVKSKKATHEITITTNTLFKPNCVLKEALQVDEYGILIRLFENFFGKKYITLDLLLILYEQSGCVIAEDLYRVVKELSDDLIHLRIKFLKYFKHSVNNLLTGYMNPLNKQTHLAHIENNFHTNLEKRLKTLLNENEQTFEELKDNDEKLNEQQIKQIIKDFVKLYNYSCSHSTHDDYEETYFSRKELDRLIGHDNSDDFWFNEYNCEKCFEVLEKLKGLN